MPYKKAFTADTASQKQPNITPCRSSWCSCKSYTPAPPTYSVKKMQHEHAGKAVVIMRKQRHAWTEWSMQHTFTSYKIAPYRRPMKTLPWNMVSRSSPFAVTSIFVAPLLALEERVTPSTAFTCKMQTFVKSSCRHLPVGDCNIITAKLSFSNAASHWDQMEAVAKEMSYLRLWEAEYVSCNPRHVGLVAIPLIQNVLSWRSFAFCLLELSALQGTDQLVDPWHLVVPWSTQPCFSLTFSISFFDLLLLLTKMLLKLINIVAVFPNTPCTSAASWCHVCVALQAMNRT